MADNSHLNPVRSGWVGGDTGKHLRGWRWSSFPAYVGGKVPGWLETNRVLRTLRLSENARCGRAYGGYLEARAPDREGILSNAALEELRKGWYLGEKGFRERLLESMAGVVVPAGKKGSVAGAAVRAHREAEAERLATAVLVVLELPSTAKELAVAALIHKRTGVPNPWIARRLGMGHEVSVKRAVRLIRESKVWSKRVNELETSLGLRNQGDPPQAMIAENPRKPLNCLLFGTGTDELPMMSPSMAMAWKQVTQGARPGSTLNFRRDSGSRFHLRGHACRAIATRVNRRAACLFASLVLISSCEEKNEVIVTETRAVTSRDTPPKLFATSGERFRNAKPSPVKGATPDGWLELPASQFRLLNYRFGETGMGEVWVSLASGSVLDNVNRWLNQFGAAPVDPAALGKLREVPIAGTTGTWVEAKGEYASGMGAASKPGFALAGVVALIDGRILTVKMVGPEAEVEAAKPALENFARGLELAE